MDVMETLRLSGPWTVADVAGLPDDGNRYELIDGVLLVSAAPRPAHQGVQLKLAVVLMDAAPPQLRVLTAPTDVVLAGDTVVQPDILVAARDAFTDENLPTAPLLAVEVLSPSNSVVDLNLKKALYERSGVASYWIIDPDTLHLTAFELRDGRYGEVASVTADQTWTATAPFAVAITPGELRY